MCPLDSNVKGAFCHRGPIKFNETQFNTITAGGQFYIVRKIAIALGLEKAAAVGTCGWVSGAVKHAAGEIAIRAVINTVKNSALGGGAYIDSRHDIFWIGRYIAFGIQRDYAHGVILGTPAIAVRIRADVTTYGIAILCAAI